MSGRIRILHVLYSMGTGGTELALKRLATELDPNRFENIICTIASPSPTEERNGIRHISLHRAGAKTGFLFPQLLRLFRRERPDVVHSRNWGAIEAVPAARFAGVRRVIHSEHGRDIHTMSGDPLRRRVFRQLCYSMSHEVVAVSSELSRHYASQLGILSKRFKVIPNGVDTTRFRPNDEARIRFRRKLGLDSNIVVLGTLARLDPVKDHRTLLRAAAQTMQAGVPLHVVIVGDGPEKQRLAELTASLPELQGHVSFVAETRQPEECLNGFDILALTSLSEGMSNTLLEAMATGLPCIATRVGSNPDLVGEGETGFLADAGDAGKIAEYICALAANMQLRHEMGMRGRRKIESEFNLRKMAESYSRLYAAETIIRPAAEAVPHRI
jgi:sugar transferase (PEP-CTERM/EpsH1 system associated)